MFHYFGGKRVSHWAAPRLHKQMQPTAGGGGGQLSRGLARFRSAPATWLEALLEEEEEGEEENNSLKPTQLPTQLPLPVSTQPAAIRNSDNFPSPADSSLLDSGPVFLRHNSTPADFLSQISPIGSDGYFSNFGFPSNYDFPVSSGDSPPATKRAREVDPSHPSPKFSSQLVINIKLERLLYFHTYTWFRINSFIWFIYFVEKRAKRRDFEFVGHWDGKAFGGFGSFPGSGQTRVCYSSPQYCREGGKINYYYLLLLFLSPTLLKLLLGSFSGFIGCWW